MFIGHFAAGVAAASHPKAPSLPVLLVAGQFVDWLFFAFLLTGWEAMRMTPNISVMNPLDLYHMPYTHSLLGAAAWAVLFAALVGSVTRNWTGALIAGAVVLSHWFFDLLVHVEDLTIAGKPPKLGFGLWDHPLAEMPLELALTFGALLLYARVCRPKMLPLALLCTVMLALQLFNWFGPVEPEVTTGTSLLAFAAFGLVTLTGWWTARTEARKRAG